MTEQVREPSPGLCAEICVSHLVQEDIEVQDTVSALGFPRSGSVSPRGLLEEQDEGASCQYSARGSKFLICSAAGDQDGAQDEDDEPPVFADVLLLPTRECARPIETEGDDDGNAIASVGGTPPPSEPAPLQPEVCQHDLARAESKSTRSRRPSVQIAQDALTDPLPTRYPSSVDGAAGEEYGKFPSTPTPRRLSQAEHEQNKLKHGASVEWCLISRRVVHVEVKVKGVFRLDTVEQTFGVQLGVIMQWTCDHDEDPPSPMEDDGDWVPKWSPKYFIAAQMREMSRDVMYSAVTGTDGSRWIRLEANHLVDIYEELELYSFPSDLQDLTIELQSKNNIDMCLWVPPVGRDDFARIEVHAFYLNDFELIKEFAYTCRMSWQYKSKADKHVSGPMSSYARITLKTARRSKYYILNSNLFVFLTTTFQLLTWAIHPADVAGRMDTDFMIILTMVSLFVSKTLMVPPLSYVTSLDIYMALNLICVIAITVSHMAVPLSVTKLSDVSPLSKAVNGTYDEEQALIDADARSFGIFAGAMVAYNAAYTAYVFARSRSEKRAYIQDARTGQAKNEAEYREKLVKAGLKEHDKNPDLHCG